MVGTAIWCAAGQITVASAASPAARLAAPAPWWVFCLAAAAASIVPEWRRNPRLAAPALLATLPWWPVPVPAAALLWTGPLAWVPIALAWWTTIGWSARLGRWPKIAFPAGRPALLAAVLTLAAGLAAAWAVAPRLPGGDEPHYLVITQSLLKDGDLRIENNHDNRDYAAFFGGTLKPDVIQRGRDGEIYSIHAPGLPALVLPGFALFGYRGAQATILVLAAVAGAFVWRAAWRATDSGPAAWFAWAAAVLSPTFLLQSATVFPDLPGAMAVAVGTWLLVELYRDDGRVDSRVLFGASAILAGLPWLHSRFAVLAGSLGALVLWRLLTDAGRPAAERRRRLAAFALLPSASVVAWLGFFYVVYGTSNPAAPYGANPEASFQFIPGGLAGLVFDGQYGLVAYTPVLALAAAGLVAGSDRDRRHVGRALVVVALAYFAAVATYWMWWAGLPAPPARFATAALPLLAVPLAAAWEQARGDARSAFRLLLALSIATAAFVIGVDRGELAWNMRDAEARWLDWLGPVVNLPRAWPSFFWRLSPDNLATEVPFLVHAAVWVAIPAAAWVAAKRVSRAPIAPGPELPLRTVWWLAASLMATAQTGWWLTGTHGLDPARSQLAVLQRLGRGAHGLRMAPGAIAWMDRPSGEMTVTSEETGRREQPPWLALTGIPAGSYELRFVTARPRAGDVAIRVGRSPRPLTVLTLAPTNDQRHRLVLPAGAAALSVEPDESLRSLGGRVELRPLEIDRWDAPLARSVLRHGSTEAFFLDDAAFVEERGFWVQGGRAAEVVYVTRAGETLDLVLRNGAAPNQVTWRVQGDERTLAMAPSEEQAARAVPDAAGLVRLRITSAGGFRPSEISASRDGRYLGVWVEVR
jgi:hypothetical protein